MTKAILTSKVSPTYDDLPEEKYHFPKTYLRQVEASLGDWIIYYEPRRSTGNLSSSGGRQAYYATARIDKIVPDASIPNHFYAFVSEYIEFDRAVPFAEGQHYYESKLRKADGSTNKGEFGRAVRRIPDEEYELILQAGFAHVLGRTMRQRPIPDVPEEPQHNFIGVAEPDSTWPVSEIALEYKRPMIEQLLTRPFRDRAFSTTVKSAYSDTCAMTGIKIINGGGRSEVQAAHIRPVADNGPDSIRNGIALSGTLHWMFDRWLISVDADYSLLIAKGKVPAAIERLLVRDRRLILPDRADLRPHPQFLAYHRKKFFKMLSQEIPI